MSERLGDDTDEVVQHHAARLTGKVIDDDAFRLLQTWADGLDDEAAGDLMDRIYGSVGDEIVETLQEPGIEADMDDCVDAFGVGVDDAE